MYPLEQWKADVERARRDYLAVVAEASPEQGEHKPSPNEWSLAEITEHLVHAEQGGINGMWSAAEAIARRQPHWTGEHVNRGLDIEQIVARTWQEKEIVPKGAGPDWGGPLEFWVIALRANQHLLAAFTTRFAQLGLDPEQVVHPHPISGPLDVRQRFQFLRFHLDRHRAQAERARKRAILLG